MLDEFKWYRKLRGGIWYKYQREVCDFETDGVRSVTIIYWSRNNNINGILLKTEKYEN